MFSIESSLLPELLDTPSIVPSLLYVCSHGAFGDFPVIKNLPNCESSDRRFSS